MNPYEELPAAKRGKVAALNSDSDVGLAEAKEEVDETKARQLEAISELNVEKKSSVTVVEETIPSIGGERDMSSVIETLGKHLVRDNKFLKAANLFARLIVNSLSVETSDLIYDVVCILMCECSSRNITDSKFAAGYIAIFEALELKLECFSEMQRYRLTSFSFYGLERIRLVTDDSYLFSKSCSSVRTAIEKLTDKDVDDELLTERQSVLLCCLETAFRNYRWQWARQPCDAAFAIAAERRLLFAHELRDQLDELTTAIVTAQRKSSSSAPSHTFRAYNSTVHPLMSKRKLGGSV